MEIITAPIESPGTEITGTAYGMIQVSTVVGESVTRGDRGLK